VSAPPTTWQELQHYPIKDHHVIDERTPTKICGITFEAFPVEHSILSPAVGYRVSAGRSRIFYAPDLIFIHDRQDALKGVQVYIGDGATVTRSFIRRRGKTLIGHSPVRTQLTWCEKEGVPSSRIAARRLSPATRASYQPSSAPWPPSEASTCALPMME
jgi:Beta-lactamase superfamily domain